MARMIVLVASVIVIRMIVTMRAVIVSRHGERSGFGTDI
jgi:hypothetical protein